MNIVILNTLRTLIELPAIMPKLAKGTEILTDAKLDPDGRIITPAVLMDAGTVLEEGFDGQKLAPGQSNVDGPYWDVLCKRRPIKQLLAVGALVNNGEGTAQALVAALDTLTTAQAKAAIVDCSNMGVLEMWADATENDGLQRLIGERKLELIELQSGRPVSGANTPDFEGPTFGANTTSAQVEGDGAPAFGIGEPAPAPAPAPAPGPAE